MNLFCILPEHGCSDGMFVDRQYCALLVVPGLKQTRHACTCQPGAQIMGNLIPARKNGGIFAL